MPDIDRFHSRGKQLCKFVGTKTFFYIRKVSIPNGCFLYTKMAAVFIVLYTNMAAVTSCENDLLDCQNETKTVKVVVIAGR